MKLAHHHRFHPTQPETIHRQKKTETLNDFLEISDVFRLHKLSWSPESVMEEFYDLRYHKKSDRQKCSTS